MRCHAMRCDDTNGLVVSSSPAPLRCISHLIILYYQVHLSARFSNVGVRVSVRVLSSAPPRCQARLDTSGLSSNQLKKEIRVHGYLSHPPPYPILQPRPMLQPGARGRTRIAKGNAIASFGGEAGKASFTSATWRALLPAPLFSPGTRSAAAKESEIQKAFA